MPRWAARISALAAVLVLSSCGAASQTRRPTDIEERPLYEVQAFEVIRRIVTENGFTPQPNWPITLVGSTPLTVDFRVGDTSFGIEWVSAEDRESLGAALPSPDPNGQLRIVPGVGSDWQAQVLVLDYRVYLYDPDPLHVRYGSTGQREVERRLEQDVRDFLDYVRSQL